MEGNNGNTNGPLGVTLAGLTPKCTTALLAAGIAHEGDLSIVILGTELPRPGSTNALLVHLVGQGPSVPREAT